MSGTMVVSSLFVPTIMIKKLTVKWTMVVSIFGYSVYIGTQFYPEFYTLIPGAIVLGLGAAPMWSAKCTYLSQVGNIYGQLTDKPVEPIIVSFFGIFFLFFQSASIWGNLISSLVLGNDDEDSNDTTDTNTTDLSTCGVNYCPWSSTSDSNSTDDNFNTSKSQLYTLA